MANAVVLLVLAVIIGAAVAYIIKAKKSGVKCIGCSAGGCSCADASAGCGCGCSGCGENNSII